MGEHHSLPALSHPPFTLNTNLLFLPLFFLSPMGVTVSAMAAVAMASGCGRGVAYMDGRVPLDVGDKCSSEDDDESNDCKHHREHDKEEPENISVFFHDCFECCIQERVFHTRRCSMGQTHQRPRTGQVCLEIRIGKHVVLWV